MAGAHLGGRGANGIGRPLTQRLLASGEQVLDVPAKLAARARVFDTGQGRKTDLNYRVPAGQSVGEGDARQAGRANALLAGPRGTEREARKGTYGVYHLRNPFPRCCCGLCRIRPQRRQTGLDG